MNIIINKYNNKINQSINPILIWKLIGSRLLLFCAWNNAYKTYNWIDLPSGNDRPNPVEPKIWGFLISLSIDKPACPYKNGMMPIPPKSG